MHRPLDFSEKEDVAQFVTENGISIMNLCHIPEDGRLKTLSFSARYKERVLEILEFGERVDGSSLFSFIDPAKSDIYILPRPERAFVNPFAAHTLNVLCEYLDENGHPLEIAPQNVLARAEESLRSASNVLLKALAELEFYVVSKGSCEILFQGASDRNYHESAPFARFEGLRNEILSTLADSGIATKYGHSEVGRILTKENVVIEQHEVELATQNLSEMAENVSISKWVIRNICERSGVSASFIPKIALEHAGTGMHIHVCAFKNNENILVDSNGGLSDEARKMIGGILKLAPSLAAFGNPTPVSYLRFIAHKESPMHICWAARNRLALVRIPLWWSFRKKKQRGNNRETFEYRAPDAYANPYLLLAGITLAICHGLSNGKEMLKTAEKLHVESEEYEQRRLKTLPCSCFESARNLSKDRRFYEDGNVFPKRLIDKTIEKLKAYDDRDLWKKLENKPAEIDELLKNNLHLS